MILAVCFQLKQLKKQPEKYSGLNRIRTRDIVILVGTASSLVNYMLSCKYISSVTQAESIIHNIS